jgi:hypothetical protein
LVNKGHVRKLLEIAWLQNRLQHIAGFDSLHPLQPRPFSFFIRKWLAGTGLIGTYQIGVTSGFRIQKPSYDDWVTTGTQGCRGIRFRPRMENTINNSTVGSQNP